MVDVKAHLEITDNINNMTLWGLGLYGVVYNIYLVFTANTHLCTSLTYWSYSWPCLRFFAVVQHCPYSCTTLKNEIKPGQFEILYGCLRFIAALWLSIIKFGHVFCFSETSSHFPGLNNLLCVHVFVITNSRIIVWHSETTLWTSFWGNYCYFNEKMDVMNQWS